MNAPAPADDRTLDPDAARAYLDAPVTDLERDNVVTLVDWFVRRYPTPAERLAYVRRAYARWTHTRLRSTDVLRRSRR